MACRKQARYVSAVKKETFCIQFFNIIYYKDYFRIKQSWINANLTSIKVTSTGIFLFSVIEQKTEGVYLYIKWWCTLCDRDYPIKYENATACVCICEAPFHSLMSLLPLMGRATSRFVHRCWRSVPERICNVYIYPKSMASSVLRAMRFSSSMQMKEKITFRI